MSNLAISRSKVRRCSPVPVNQCGAAIALDILADKWTLLIVREAFYGVVRYEDIRADIRIPRSVLTQRLKHLVEHNIMQREPYQEAGSRTRYAYTLTNKGKELALTILALMQWGDKHLKSGVAAIDVFARHSGQSLKVGLVPKTQTTASLADIDIKVLLPRKNS